MTETNDDLSVQDICAKGQSLLMATRYRAAEATLESAEAAAWASEDFDAISRLYMPLQEARRQIRQRAGEGVSALHLIATSAEEAAKEEWDPAKIAVEFPQAQVLLAGWGTLAPAIRLRKIQKTEGLLAEAFLAAAYPILGGGVAVAMVPEGLREMPDPAPRSVDELLRLLPAHTVLLPRGDLPFHAERETPRTFATACRLWETLHLPYLAAADAEALPVRRLAAYRKVIQVDEGCELAHQKLSMLAREIARERLRESRHLAGETL